jgi:hypothetical protein
MCGTEVMKGRDIAGFLHFPPGEPSQAVHREQLFALFDEWEQGTLSDFLKFTTGLCVLPIGGLKNPEVCWGGERFIQFASPRSRFASSRGSPHEDLETGPLELIMRRKQVNNMMDCIPVFDFVL